MVLLHCYFENTISFNILVINILQQKQLSLNLKNAEKKRKNFGVCFMGFFLTIFTLAAFQGHLPYHLGLFQIEAQLYIHATICNGCVSR